MTNGFRDAVEEELRKKKHPVSPAYREMEKRLKVVEQTLPEVSDQPSTWQKALYYASTTLEKLFTPATVTGATYREMEKQLKAVPPQKPLESARAYKERLTSLGIEKPELKVIAPWQEDWLKTQGLTGEGIATYKEILPGGKLYEEFQELPWTQQLKYELPFWGAITLVPGAMATRAALAPAAARPGVAAIAPKVARAALAPIEYVIERPIAAGLKYGIGFPLKYAGKGIETGTRKAFETALDAGLDKWIVRQGIRADQAPKVIQFFLTKNHAWLYRTAQDNLVKRMAQRRGTQAATQAVDDTIKQAEPLLLQASKEVAIEVPTKVPAVVKPVAPAVKPAVPPVKPVAPEVVPPEVKEAISTFLATPDEQIVRASDKVIEALKARGFSSDYIQAKMTIPEMKQALAQPIPKAVPEVTGAVVPAVKPPVTKPISETTRLVLRRTELKELLAKPAKELPKDVKKIELRQELKGVSAKLVPAEKKLRQTIMATVKEKSLPQSQYRKIFKDVGGSRQLSDITFTGLNKVLASVQTARPVKIKGKIVLKPQTERNIQSLKDILITEQRLTPEIYEVIKKDLDLPTDRFESATRFITEAEARNLIRQMNYEAESGLAEWDAKVTGSLVDKPEIKASIDKLSSTIERENLSLPKKRVGINWGKFAFEISEVPNDVGLSGTMSVLRALRRFQEQLGGRAATRIYDIAEMAIETRQLNEVRLTQRISGMKAEVPALARIVQSEKSMKLVQQWLDADLAIAKVEKPTLTDTELEVAKLFRREYDQWKGTVRLERFKDAYYHYKGNAELMVSGTERTGDIAISDAPLVDIKEAIRIYESQGETALNKFLETKTWGVLKSGYSFSQVIHPQLRTYQGLSVRATTTSLHQRKGLDFRKDERTAWERLIAYERQMIGLNLQPYFRKMDREFRHIAELGRLADPGADANKISLFLREVKGFPIESPVVRVLLRIGGWSFGTLAKVPWMSIRNLHQNVAFHPDKAEVLKVLATGGFFGDPLTRNGRLNYTNTLVHQFQGVVQEQLLMGYMGKTPIENLIRASDYYHLSDKVNRSASMAGSGAKADRALKAFAKDGDAEKFLRNSGANELSLTEQVRILEYLSLPSYNYGGVLDAVSGGEASIRDVGKRITTLTHFNYIRYLRSITEMGEMGRIAGSLVAFPRSVIERYADFFSRLRPARKLSGDARRRAFHSLMAMVVGSVVASAILATITGKKRDAYNPLLVLQWQVGGLAIGAAQELSELYRHLSNLTFAKEESERDYALKELTLLIPRLGDMFIPFYASTMNAIEGLYDERYIDRKILRQLRALFDENYKPNLEFYEIERTAIEKWQHGLFGARTPDPTDLEKALSDLKGIENKLGLIDEEAVEKAREWRTERIKELESKNISELTLAERRDLTRIRAFEYDPSDYIYTTSNLASDFNSAVYGLDPTVITLENGFSPLLLDYLEYQEMFNEYKAVPADKRYDFRKRNPEIDANLFFWGYVTTLQTEGGPNSARALVEQMIGRYGIPRGSIRGYETASPTGTTPEFTPSPSLIKEVEERLRRR